MKINPNTVPTPPSHCHRDHAPIIFEARACPLCEALGALDDAQADLDFALEEVEDLRVHLDDTGWRENFGYGR